MKFCTLKEASTAEIVEKKSRFIANSCHIESKEEAEEKINLIKKKYYDAKHNCFAFSIVDKDGNLLEKSSDDGEPSGTAGAPILNVIRKNNLNNVLIVVTRYFGGVLLGTGGLIRAYTSASKEALDDCLTGELVEGVHAYLDADYNYVGKIQHLCIQDDITVVNTEYSDNVIFELMMEKQVRQKFEKALTEMSSGSIGLREIKEVKMYRDGRGILSL